MARKAERVVHAVEPILHTIHRYLVVVYKKRGKGFWYRYCANRQEVRDLKKKAKPGTYLEVFKASHDFKEAWQIK